MPRLRENTIFECLSRCRVPATTPSTELPCTCYTNYEIIVSFTIHCGELATHPGRVSRVLEDQPPHLRTAKSPYATSPTMSSGEQDDGPNDTLVNNGKFIRRGTVLVIEKRRRSTGAGNPSVERLAGNRTASGSRIRDLMKAASAIARTGCLGEIRGGEAFDP